MRHSQPELPKPIATVIVCLSLGALVAYALTIVTWLVCLFLK